MSQFFDELEAQLDAAARAQAGARGTAPRRPRRPGWLRARLDLAPVLAAFVVAVVVVGGALALLGHGHHSPSSPPPSPPAGGGFSALVAKTPPRQLRREMSYITAATRAVLSSRACRLAQPTGVTFIHGSPSPSLLATLGVLRRPASPFDRLDPMLLSGMPDQVYAGHQRRVGPFAGVSYYIVPTRYNRAAEVPSARCFDLQTAALARQLPKLPVALREPTRALQAALIGYARQLAAQAPRDALCLVNVGGNENGASCGISVTDVKQGLARQDNQGTFFGVVPDGVARVTLRFPAAQGQPAHSVTAVVKDNVYALRAGETNPRIAQPTAVIWRSARGRVLKTMAAPSPAAVASACRVHPVACFAVQYGVTESSSSSGPVTAAPARGH